MRAAGSPSGRAQHRHAGPAAPTRAGCRIPAGREYDTGAEQLSILATKIAGYHDLFTTIGRSWPVLFWLHSAARERNLRTWLADLRTAVPIATGARDHATAESLSPADAVWALPGDGHHRVLLVALDDLDLTRSRLWADT
jgi:hypothetical protein